MLFCTKLPDVLINSVMLVWSELKDLGKFDTALCNNAARDVFLVAINQQSSSQPLIVDNNESSVCKVSWLVNKEIHPTIMRFSTISVKGNGERYDQRCSLAMTDLFSDDIQFLSVGHILQLTFIGISGDRCMRSNMLRNVVKFINRCTSLTVLNFDYCGIANFDLITGVHKSIWRGLQRLTYDHNGYRDVSTSFHCLSKSIKNLTELQFTHNSSNSFINPADICRMLRKNPNLTILKIGVIAMADFSFLETVRTVCTSISDFRYSTISAVGFPEVQYLLDFVNEPPKSLITFHFKMCDKEGNLHSSLDFNLDNRTGLNVKVRDMRDESDLKRLLSRLTDLDSVLDITGFKGSGLLLCGDALRNWITAGCNLY